MIFANDTPVAMHNTIRLSPLDLRNMTNNFRIFCPDTMEEFEQVPYMDDMTGQHG